MISLINVSTAQKLLAEHIRQRRVQMGFTQAGLAVRAGVCLPTLRKFEQKGLISLESFLKMAQVLGFLESLIQCTQSTMTPFTTIDDVIAANTTPKRKKGWRT